MSNPFDDMYSAIRDAETTIAAADGVTARMAKLLVGRLRKADIWTLTKIKRELQDFDAHKKEWK